MATQVSLTTTTASSAQMERSSTAWFWWKETRQLAPLVVLLVAVAALTGISSIFTGSIFRSLSPEVMLNLAILIMPGLFATGAGPLLIGQERAERTLDWLVLLPITPQRLILTKFLVAVAGLVVMWACTLVLQALFTEIAAGGPSTVFMGSVSIPLFMVHSLYVLVAGFYATWRIEHPFRALIALVLLALTPFIATSLLSVIIDQPLQTDTFNVWNIGAAILGIAILLPLAFRAGRTALAPDAAPVVHELPIGTTSPAAQLADATPPQFSMRLAAIAWQSFHAGRAMYLTCTAMLLVAWLAAWRLYNITQARRFDELCFVLMLAAPLAVCWLGVSVFVHDGATQRIRFLADRGISHRVAYCGLHALPLSLLTAALLCYGLWHLLDAPASTEDVLAGSLPTMWPMLFFAVTIYAVSQWASQLMRTFVLAVILALITAAIVCSWLAFCFVMFDFPFWGMSVCAVLPLLTTALLMRRYADGTDRPLSFIAGALTLLLLIAIPLGHAAWQVQQVSTLDRSTRQQLMSEAQQLVRPDTLPRSIALVGVWGYDAADQSDPRTDPIEQIESYRRSVVDAPAAVLRQLNHYDAGAVSMDSYTYGNWHGHFLLHRYRWLLDDDQWQSFTPWLTTSARLLPALRRSTLLPDQHTADRLEVLLLDTLAQPQIQKHRDDPAVQKAIDSIGTADTRAQARRQAALATWWYLQQPNQQEGTFAGRRTHSLALTATEQVPPGLVDWMTPRLHDAFLVGLLDGSDAAKRRETQQAWRRALHALHQPDTNFETSRYGEAMRALPPMETMTTHQITGYGQLWGMDWEYVRPEMLLEDDSP